MNAHFDTFRTRFGAFSIAVDSANRVIGAAFGDATALASRLRDVRLVSDPAAVREPREAVLAYCEGEPRPVRLRLAPRGTTFQQRVWSALQTIPFGGTRSYGQLAAELGNPAASRAVGRANATNPICLLVPCHRVIGSDGSLTGFAFGEKLKRLLLEHEQAGRVIPNAPLRVEPAA